MLANAPALIGAELENLLKLLTSASQAQAVEPGELRVRAEQFSARLRDVWRDASELSAERQIQLGALSIDLAAHEVIAGEQRVLLTPREFALLAFLARHRGRVCTRAEIIANVWPERRLASGRTVDIHVYRLRSKLTPHADGIETVRQVGYIFREPPPLAAAE